jgi:hypothetical protein
VIVLTSSLVMALPLAWNEWTFVCLAGFSLSL